MTIGKVVAAYEAMSKLLDVQLKGPEGFKKLYALAQVHRAMKDGFDFFAKQQKAIVERNRGKVKDGFATFTKPDGTTDEEAVAAVSDAMQKLSETEIPDFPKKVSLPFSLFSEEAQLNTRDFLALSEFIDFEEA